MMMPDKAQTNHDNHDCLFYCKSVLQLFMAEFCEHCGKSMKRWDATHCSEYCLLASIKDSKSLHIGCMEKMIHDMGKEKHYDIKLLEDLK